MIGQKIIELDRVDSTNSYAGKDFPSAVFEEGTVIWAHEQYAGRGQHDHVWASEAKKNLTLTVCLQPHFLEPERQFQLNKAISLGVLDFLRFCCESVTTIPSNITHLKWPNDLYVDKLKIGGILIEHKIMGLRLESSIAGIGLNINQQRFSSEIPNPVSLFHILNHETVLKEALLSLCGFLDKRYMALRNGEQSLDEDYNNSLLGYSVWRTFRCGGLLMDGKIRGVDDSGRLCIETREGKVLCFGHGEVEFVF
ncbi:MAG: biotin--[acetyl-CoA-carboxylase] ligase [Bacteroidales bacterium]